MPETNPYSILVVDDEASLRKLLGVVFREEGYDVLSAEDGAEAVEAFSRHRPDLVLMDIRMPKTDGLAALKELKTLDANIPVVLMTAFAGIETAVEALRQGAFDYIVKPFDLGELKRLVKRAFRANEAVPGLQSDDALEAALSSREGRHEKMLTNSANMKALFRDIAKMSRSNSTVLVTGESGTGKELVAKAIHYHSTRETGPFVKVNCGALPENLLESTLFGHVKGAFTGAHACQTGLFERANHGTLLLDEVGEMSPNLQVKFLRVLQEKEFEPIGSARTIRTDFRLIAATNRNLREMVEGGQFRQDLFYRLNVMTVSLPPLRHRPDDILLLARHFVQRFCSENQRAMLGFSEETVRVLNGYSWPGNIRELSNAMERAVIMSAGAFIYPEDLPEQIRMAEQEKHPVASTGNIPGRNLRDSMKTVEKELIVTALRQNGGHRELTARTLGVSKRTLLYKLQEHNIESE